MRTVILVEDENYLLEGMRLILEDGGYQVQTAGSGGEALELVQANAEARPSIIVTDVIMPGMDGIDLLHAVRDDPACVEIPFLFVSATSAEGMQARIQGLPHTAFLRKPFQIEDLFASIERLLDA
ncbi:MAG: response regulator [Anaerolineae bacterium]|nr:response regulator [Anaerolineae bacterium]